MMHGTIYIKMDSKVLHALRQSLQDTDTSGFKTKLIES